MLCLVHKGNPLAWRLFEEEKSFGGEKEAVCTAFGCIHFLQKGRVVEVGVAVVEELVDGGGDGVKGAAEVFVGKSVIVLEAVMEEVGDQLFLLL
jgi:hypothetical protein